MSAPVTPAPVTPADVITTGRVIRNMAEALRALLPEVDCQIMLCRHGCNHDDWEELQNLSTSAHIALRQFDDACKLMAEDE
jgi:orotate phosphoribosyltransferase